MPRWSSTTSRSTASWTAASRPARPTHTMPVSPSPLADPAVLDLLARAGVDPADGLQVVALDRLASRPFDPGVALLLLPAGSAPLATQPDASTQAAALPGRHGHGADPVALLQRLYPADHPILRRRGRRDGRDGGRGRAGRRAGPPAATRRRAQRGGRLRPRLARRTACASLTAAPGTASRTT